MNIRFGSFWKQSRTRKILNIVGLLCSSVILLELFLRGIGFLLGLQLLHFSILSPKSTHTGHTILCIGDSWTGGQLSGNYPDYLQEKLNIVYSDPQFQVVNLGRAGTNSSQGIRRLVKYLPIYQPDIIIVMIGNNDHYQLAESVYWQFIDQKLDTLSIWGAKIRVFLHSLRAYRLFKIIYYQLTGIPTPNKFYYSTPEDQPETRKPPSAINPQTAGKMLEYNLLKFIELSQQYGLKLVFQTYFHFHGYHVNEIIRDTAMKYHIPLVDNNLLFHQKIAVADREKYLVPDGHPNPLGYQFIADNILNMLQEEKLIP